MATVGVGWKRKVAQATAGLCVALTLPCSASACSRTYLSQLFDSDRNRPTVQFQSGSFRNAGKFDEWQGRSAFDLGNGRIGQVVEYEFACADVEFLTLVDCEAREMAAVTTAPFDLPESRAWDGLFYRVTDLLPPEGALAEVAGGPVAAMRAHLIAQGARGFNELFAMNKAEARPDQFNPYAGCKKFYPESPGATYEWPKA